MTMSNASGQIRTSEVLRSSLPSFVRGMPTEALLHARIIRVRTLFIVARSIDEYSRLSDFHPSPLFLFERSDLPRARVHVQRTFRVCYHFDFSLPCASDPAIISSSHCVRMPLLHSPTVNFPGTTMENTVSTWRTYSIRESELIEPGTFGVPRRRWRTIWNVSQSRSSFCTSFAIFAFNLQQMWNGVPTKARRGVRKERRTLARDRTRRRECDKVPKDYTWLITRNNSPAAL